MELVYEAGDGGQTQFHAIDYATSMVEPLEEEEWSWMGGEYLCDFAKVLCSEEVSKFNCENDSLSAKFEGKCCSSAAQRKCLLCSQPSGKTYDGCS